MTIYDIARIAGVSASTVSRVVNGKAGVGKQRREQILALLKEHNYIPDETARRLITQDTRTVGILVDDLNSVHIVTSVSIIQNELLKNGYHCYIVCVDGDAESIEAGLTALIGHKVAAVFLLGLCFHDHEIVKANIEKHLRDKPVVLVMQSEKIDLDNVYVVGADETAGISQCVELLVNRGRRNLLMLIDRGRGSTDRLKHIFEAKVRSVPGVCGTVVTDVPSRGAEGEAAARRLLRECPEADGLLCMHDRIAINMIYEFQKNGRRVPEDVSVIGEDNSELCTVCRPKLSSLDNMLQQVTLLCTQILMAVLRGEPRENHILLNMEIVQRESI